MHKTVAEARLLAEEVKKGAEKASHCQVVIAPPFTALHEVAAVLRGARVVLAAQNVHWELQGAFTGEIGITMLQDLGCVMVILGHSERRQYFGETDETVNRRLHAVIDAGMQAIVCIGESLDERDAGRHYDVVTQQLAGGLDGLTQQGLLRIILAYEPVWAIGTGRTASPETAQEMHGHIRRRLIGKFGDAAEKVRILYGGSVKPNNIASLMRQPDVDGALVGGACLEAESFLDIIHYQS